MYINIESGDVITRQELEDLHKDPIVMFPPDISDEVLEDFGYANVELRQPPQVDKDQTVERGDVVKDDNGYHYEWLIKERIVTPDEVDIERDRRVDLGVTYNGEVYQSKIGDRENIAGASQLAMMAIMDGAKKGDYRWAYENTDFQWITADNEVVKLDAYETFALGKAAAETKQKLIFAARQLKDMNPIPSDFTDDKWWT